MKSLIRRAPPRHRFVAMTTAALLATFGTCALDRRHQRGNYPPGVTLSQIYRGVTLIIIIRPVRHSPAGKPQPRRRPAAATGSPADSGARRSGQRRRGLPAARPPRDRPVAHPQPQSSIVALADANVGHAPISRQRISVGAPPNTEINAHHPQGRGAVVSRLLAEYLPFGRVGRASRRTARSTSPCSLAGLMGRARDPVRGGEG